MPLPFCLKGAIIGLSIAAPVGPIGVLIVNECLDATIEKKTS